MKDKIILLVVAIIIIGSILIIYKATFKTSGKIGPKEYAIYDTYRSEYLAADGAVISNYQPVPWCPNSGIGCDNEITSEAISKADDEIKKKNGEPNNKPFHHQDVHRSRDDPTYGSVRPAEKEVKGSYFCSVCSLYKVENEGDLCSQCEKDWDSMGGKRKT